MLTHVTIIKLTMFPKRLSLGNWNASNKPEIPKILTFDAYNTLYATTLPVMEQYCLVGKKYGIEADPKQLTQNFPVVFKALKEEHPNYGKYTNINAKQWWSYLIVNMFKSYKVPNEMIDEILERFEGPNAYIVYPDLLELLNYIKAKHPNVVLGIISNTDPLVYTLIKNIGLFDYFKTHLYLSYDLDIKKPSKEIFQYVFDDIINKHPRMLECSTEAELKKRCWHVGDEAENDMLGAVMAGWNGILIDRSNKYGYFSGLSSKKKRTDNSISVDKIDHNFEESWSESMKQTDSIQLSENTFVISNYNVLKSIMF